MTPQNAGGWTIVNILHRVGEQVMMDFGLSGLLDRIERDFGKKWAKSITILIGVAIVAGCLTLVGNLISAFSLWLSGITSESTVWAKLVFVGKYLLGFSLLIILANNLVSLATVRNFNAMAVRHLVDSEDLLRRSEAGGVRLEEHIEILRDIVKRMAEINENEAINADLWAFYEKIGGCAVKDAPPPPPLPSGTAKRKRQKNPRD